MYSATDGQLFILTFMNLSLSDSTRQGFQQVMISSAEDAAVRALIPGINKTVFFELSAANNHQFQLILSEDMAMAKDSQIVKIGLQVSSNVSISVQASKAQAGSTDGYNAIPVTANATEFFIPSWPGHPQGHSLFGIISLMDGTCTEVYRVNNDGDYQRLWFFGMEELDVFQGISDTDDFSGLYINSTKPIGVVSGNECGQVPHQTPYCDHMIVQPPALIDWGKEYIIGGIDGRKRTAGYYIRIYGSVKNTAVTATVLTGSPKSFDTPASDQFTGSVNTGQFIELIVQDTMSAVAVTCSEKCMVVRMNPSVKVVADEIVDTDPYMDIIPPLDHYKNIFSFATAKFYYDNSTKPFKAEDMISFITIIAHGPITSGIRLDGNGLGSAWTGFSGAVADYSVTSLPISPGFHVVSHPDAQARFAVFVYGHGEDRINTGYGYLGGWKRKWSKASVVTHLCKNTEAL